MSRLHVHRGFIQLLKLWLNLCSFRWLNPSQSLVINLSPSGSKMQNIGLGMGWKIFITLALKILKLDVSILKLSLFHLFIIPGIYSSTNWPPVYHSQIGNLKVSFETLSPLNKKKKSIENYLHYLKRALVILFLPFGAINGAKSLYKKKNFSPENNTWMQQTSFSAIFLLNKTTDFPNNPHSLDPCINEVLDRRH